MALGIGKKSCERLGIKLSDVERIAMLAPCNYNQWNSTRDKFQRLFPQTDKWIRSCYHMPRQDDCIMEMFNELLDGFGVEAIRGQHVDNYYYDCNATYINMGDTYDLTIVYDTRNDRYMVTSMGDFAEYLEHKGYEIY